MRPMQKVLVTGSEGNIGSVLIRSLEGNYQLMGLDKLPLAAHSHVARYVQADISNLSDLKLAFQELGPIDAVIHLAADARADAPWESILQNNIIGTHNLYEVAKDTGVRRIIFASSNHVTTGYNGFPEKDYSHLISTADPVRPDSDYALSKLFGENIARYYYDQFGLSSICLRIGSMRADNNPASDPEGPDMRRWLSHRDLLQLITKSLETTVPFGIYYGVSNNKMGYHDISNAREELGYSPQDDASSL